MPRTLPSLAVLLLCSTALAGCETMSSINPFGGTSADRASVEQQVKSAQVAQPAMTVPGNITNGVRQAHELRLAGKYDDASHILSQLMLVASDDPRVVGEYGKTLLERGRAQDAALFLSRAVELQQGDWTTYSALGVAYDQLGNQDSARTAYDRALALAPREASVLSNYALSRMLAGDISQARLLAARAQAVGGNDDPKIARNIALIEAAPQSMTQPVAANSQPAPQVATAAPAPLATPLLRTATATPAPVSTPVTTAATAPQPVKAAAAAPATPVKTAVATPVVQPSATAAPRILMRQTASNSLPPGTQPFIGVVMQPVPVDTLVGPVKPKPAAKPAQPVAVAKADKPTSEKPVTATVPAKVASATPAKPVTVAPAKVASTTPAKPVSPATATAKPAEPVKTAAAAPAKPATAAAPAAATKPDGVPALRLAADASTP